MFNKTLLTAALTICFSTQLLADELDQKLRSYLADAEVHSTSFTADRTSPLFRLGEALFNEPLLSGNKNISCATCHAPALGTSDALPLSIGEGGEGLGTDRKLVNGRVIARHSPSIYNFGVNKPTIMFWDARVSYDSKKHVFQTPEKGLNGRNPKLKKLTSVLNSASNPTLAAQALFPPTSHDEMRGLKGSNKIAGFKSNAKVWSALMARLVGKHNGKLGGVKLYKKMFLKAFPDVESIDDLNFAHAAVAIAHFEENQFTSLDAPLDRYLRGDNNAMTQTEKRGAIVFYGPGRCFQCHQGILQADGKLHNSAFPQIGPGKEANGNDKGRFYITNDSEELYRFKTPSLRNLALSAPYGHSGSVATIEDSIAHYTNPVQFNTEYTLPFSDLPYDLVIQESELADRLRNIDAVILGGVPIKADDRADLAQFIRTGLLSPTP